MTDVANIINNNATVNTNVTANVITNVDDTSVLVLAGKDFTIAGVTPLNKLNIVAGRYSTKHNDIILHVLITIQQKGTSSNSR